MAFALWLSNCKAVLLSEEGNDKKHITRQSIDREITMQLYIPHVTVKIAPSQPLIISQTSSFKYLQEQMYTEVLSRQLTDGSSLLCAVTCTKGGPRIIII